jgi:hypothetical protein
MARNRRKVEGEVTLSWMAARLLLFMLVVGCLLGITILKSRNLKMGEELSRLDRELKQSAELTSNLEAQITRYKAPRELEAKLARWHLNMMHPVEAQIRRFSEPDARTFAVIKPKFLVQSQPLVTKTRIP